MSTPKRPTTSITYQQGKQFLDSRVKWYDFYGHIVCIKELADIFGIAHVTLLKRLEANWPVNAALMAPTTQMWTHHTIQYFADALPEELIIATLHNHFNPIKLNLKVKKGVK